MSENVDLSNENTNDVKNSETVLEDTLRLRRKMNWMMRMMAVMASTSAAILWAIFLATLTACH
jgi:mannosyltransferase OCH1-like enzyme